MHSIGARIVLAAGILLASNLHAPADPAPKLPAAKLDAAGEPLPEGARARMGTTRFHHDASSVAFLDAKTLVTAGDGVRIWDLESGKIRREFKIGEFDDDRPAILSADGRTLISTQRDSSLRIWDMTNGKLLGTRQKNAPERRGDSVVILQVSRDGKRFASMREVENRIWVWSLDKQREISRIDVPEGYTLMTLAMSPDGKSIATAFNIEDGKREKTRLDIWDAATGKRIRSQEPELGEILKVEFSPDGSKLALLGETGLVIHDSHGKQLWKMKHEMPAINAGAAVHMLFSADMKTLITVAPIFDQAGQLGKSEIRAIDAVNGLTRQTWQIPTTWFAAGAVSPDSKTLATVGGGTIHFWNLADGKEIRPTSGHPNAICTTCITPDGRYVASTDFFDLDIRFWEIATGKQVRQFRGHTAGCVEIVFSPDGKLLASSSYDRTVRVWDVATGREVAKFDGFPQAIWHLRFKLDNRTLVVAPPGGSEITLLDVKTGKKMSSHSRGPGYMLSALVRHPDGRILALGQSFQFNQNGMQQSSVVVWDVLGDRLVHQFDSQGGRVSCALLSPDGRTLATRGYDGVFRLWEMATGELRAQFEEGGDGAGQTGTQMFAFSPDGTTIASASRGEAKVYLWDVATGQLISSFAAHSKPMYTVEYTPDGNTLVTGSQDSTLMSWDMTLPKRHALSSFVSLTDASRAMHWEKLAGSAEEANLSIWALAADRSHAVKFLGGKFAKPKLAPSDQIKQWIDDLDSRQYAVRERAEKKLQAHADQAEAELRKALATSAEAEGRKRISRILESANSRSSPDVVREVRAIEVLEKIGTPDAIELLKSLAGGKVRMRIAREAEQSLRRLAH